MKFDTVVQILESILKINVNETHKKQSNIYTNQWWTNHQKLELKSKSDATMQQNQLLCSFV